MVTVYSKEPQRGLLAQAQHYWHVLLKWKWTAFLFFFIVVSGATIYSFRLTPVFTSSGSVWIEDEANILPFEDVQSFVAGTNLQSQARLLQSRTLASYIIDKLKLYENPDYLRTQSPHKFSVAVNLALYDSIETPISQYLSDLENDGFDPVLYTWLGGGTQGQPGPGAAAVPFHGPRFVRSADRSWSTPAYRSYSLGFRLTRDL